MRRLFCTLGSAGSREWGSKQRSWLHSNLGPSAEGPWELARPGDPWKRRRGALCPSCRWGPVAWAPSSSETRLRLPFDMNQMCEHLTLPGRGHSEAPQPLGRGLIRSCGWWPSPAPSPLLPSLPHPIPPWPPPLPCISPPHQQEVTLDRSQTSLCPGQSL